MEIFGKKALVFDVESDGLLDEATKLHCIATSPVDEFATPKSSTSLDAMREFFSADIVRIGHNIACYDIPLVEKLLGIKVGGLFVDTLALSWYLYPERTLHGLDAIGRIHGIMKPVVHDWEGLTPEEYQHRCKEDVRINRKEFITQLGDLRRLYKDPKKLEGFLRFMYAKMSALRDATTTGLLVDGDHVISWIQKLGDLEAPKVAELKDVMPQEKVYGIQKRPKNTHKKDGSPTESYKRFLERLGEKDTGQKEAKYLKELREANPQSPSQVKSWLFSLGWEPCTYNYVKESGGGERKIPQVREGGLLTGSVEKLAEKEPAVALLSDLTVVQHRRGILKAIAESAHNGRVRATAAGFTNTLRLRHSRPCVNLPGVNSAYGQAVRPSFIADEGYVLVGSDLSSLEDTTKRHFIQPLDPAYVESMSAPDFDPHLDLGVFAGLISQDDYSFFKEWNDSEDCPDKSRLKAIKSERKALKVVNYSATYGVRPKKLSLTTGLSLSRAGELLDAFWERNWAVQKVADDLTVRKIGGKMWLENPLNGYYYSLRSDKDRFSTLNQGTGAYIFELWMSVARGMLSKIFSDDPLVGKIQAQFHDELVFQVPDSEEAKVAAKEILDSALQVVSNKVKMRVRLGCDVQFGRSYGDIH